MATTYAFIPETELAAQITADPTKQSKFDVIANFSYVWPLGTIEVTDASGQKTTINNASIVVREVEVKDWKPEHDTILNLAVTEYNKKATAKIPANMTLKGSVDFARTKKDEHLKDKEV